MPKFLSNINLESANDVQFKTTAGVAAGKIEQDGNDLVLSNAVGDVLLGDGTSDVYIGDGANSVDILFEQSGSIKGDGSAVTLTLGGSNTTLNLENPNINGTLSVGATNISDKLTFTTTNGYILFDYEPSGDTGEYTTEVPLLKVGMGTAETAILSRISEYRGVVLGADDTVWLRAGDTGAVIKTNVGLTTEVVLMSAEQGFHAYAFPDNDTAWSNRNEFRFYGGSDTAADNGLYIGDGGNTQFIDLSRNLTVGTIDSGAITSTGKITGTELEGTSLDINGSANISGLLTWSGTDYEDAINLSEGDINNVNEINAYEFKQRATGEPRSNLGSPTVTEMGLFDSQFTPKTTLANGYDDLADLKFFTRATGSNENDYAEVTTYSDDEKRKFLRTNNSSVIIDNTHNSFRVEFVARGYTYANAMYAYWSSQSHNTQVQVYKYNVANSAWVQHTSSTTTVSSWPGHLYLPFSQIPWNETETTSTTHYEKIRIEFTPTWVAYSGSGTNYSARDILLYGMQIWGGYPGTHKRTVHSYDQNGKLDLFKDLGLPDNGFATFGSGDDLQIYHDGSNSYIKDGGTGDLRIWADSPNISTASGNKIFYGNSGAAELYFTGGNKKLETVTGGVLVTGELEATTLDINGAADISGTLTVGVDDTGYDVKFFGATASHYMLWDESADLLQVAGDLQIKNPHGSNPADAGSLVFNETGTTWGSNMFGFRLNLEGDSNLLQFQSANNSTVSTILTMGRDNLVSTFSGPLTVGVNDTGHDVKFFGATSGKKMLWDESDDTLVVDGTLDINGDADISGALTLGTALAAAEGGTGLTSISTLLNSNVTSVSGNAGTVTINSDFSGTYPLLVEVTSSGIIYNNPSITYNGTSDTLTSPNFSGNLTGNVTGSSGSCTGNAATATTLATARALQVTLTETDSANFNGSADVTDIGVTGTLAVSNGGTGVTSLTALKNALDDETWSFANNVTLSGFVLDSNTITGVDDSSEFTNDDAHIMTSAAINDRFAQINADTTGQAGTVATIAGLAPDTATTQVTQPNITTMTGFLGGNANALITDDGDGTVTSESQLTYDGAGTLKINTGNYSPGRPQIILENSDTDAGDCPKFLFVRRTTGADDQDLGSIEWSGDNDANQIDIVYASILGEISDASDGAEGGKLSLGVASHDGGVERGLILEDGNADGEVDVTIAAGVASTTTISGELIAKRRRFDITASGTNGDGNGDIIYFGTIATSLVAGTIYYYASNGEWTLTDANTADSAKSKGLLGVALGTTIAEGILLRGVVTLVDVGDPETVGLPLFLSGDVGQATTTRPSANGDTVRILGYLLDDANDMAWFNPDNTFVEVTA